MAGGVKIEVPVSHMVPEQISYNITDYSFEEAKEKINNLVDDFNENLYTFEYELICKVTIKLIK